MQAILELNNVHLQRGDFTLRVERLQLLEQRLYALQGVNGAGKSSLLQLLALLLPPDAGEIRFQQQLVPGHAAGLRPLRQQITLLEQNPLLFSGNVEQNLSFGLKIRRIHGQLQQQRIAQALETTGLQGFEKRPATELSGGEQRRVALARALVLQPQLLLLDEPTANLDASQVAALERFLVQLPQQGICVVISTHDALQPTRLGGEIIHLAAGRLLQTDPPGDPQDYQPILRQVKG